MRPEMAGIFASKPFSCGAERLARVTAREDVHSVSKAFPREGLEIRPDRSRIKRPAVHSRK